MLMPCSMLHWRQVEHGRHGWLGRLAAWLPLFFFATIAFWSVVSLRLLAGSLVE